MRILLRVLVVFAFVSGLYELARAEEDSWLEASEEDKWSDVYDADDLTGAVEVDLSLPTAGALDPLPDSSLDSADSAPESSTDSSDGSSLASAEEEDDAPTVELYITSWCGYCRQAREFLRARGIPFVEYDIEQDANAARRKQDLKGGSGVPVAVINGQVVVGFSHSVYENALRTAQ